MSHWQGGNPHESEPIETDEQDLMIEEPDYDDTVHTCPNCERPQQFSGLCMSCVEEMRQSPNDPFWDSVGL